MGIDGKPMVQSVAVHPSQRTRRGTRSWAGNRGSLTSFGMTRVSVGQGLKPSPVATSRRPEGRLFHQNLTLAGRQLSQTATVSASASTSASFICLGCQRQRGSSARGSPVRAKERVRAET